MAPLSRAFSLGLPLYILSCGLGQGAASPFLQSLLLRISFIVSIVAGAREADGPFFQKQIERTS